LLDLGTLFSHGETMLEQLYPLQLLEKHWGYAFLLGVVYSVVGIGAAMLLFPQDPALVAVAFISLIILPTMNKLLKEEEELESRKDEFSLHTFYIDHKNVFFIYGCFFLAILFTFAFFAIVLPSLATNHIFESQLGVLYSTMTGKAAFSQPLFMKIFTNNVVILILCFATAFVIGDGAIFLIAWNASVWGTIFGSMAKNAALVQGQNPFILFFIVLLVVFPHMILEAIAYISSASAGGVISKAFMKEKLFSERFDHILRNTLIVFIVAIAVLLLSVVVETYVLGNVEVYREIIKASFMK